MRAQKRFSCPWMDNHGQAALRNWLQGQRAASQVMACFGLICGVDILEQHS